jgi:hypothetical protein
MLSRMIWRLFVLQNCDARHPSYPVLRPAFCRPVVQQPLPSGPHGADDAEPARGFDAHRLGPVRFPQHEGSPCRRPCPIVGFPQPRQRLIFGQNTGNPGERRQGLSRFLGCASSIVTAKQAFKARWKIGLPRAAGQF